MPVCALKQTPHMQMKEALASGAGREAPTKGGKFVPLDRCEDVAASEDVEASTLLTDEEEHAQMKPPSFWEKANTLPAEEGPARRRQQLRWAAAACLGFVALAAAGAGVSGVRRGVGAETGLRGGAIGLMEDGVAKCKNAEEHDRCMKAIRWAMTDGMANHPEWYPDLDSLSSVLDFQQQLHKTDPDHCPTPPCWSPPSRHTCADPLYLFDDRCSTAKKGDKCWHAIEHARTKGIEEHPERYAPLTAKSSLKDFQAHVHRLSPTKCPKPCSDAAEGGSCICLPPLVNKGKDEDGHAMCLPDDDAQTMTFYMYRALGQDVPALENANTANLAGVLSYLHEEVLGSERRKNNISQIVRYKVTVRNPARFVDEFKLQFGPFVDFDAGKCVVEGCGALWSRFGPVVGCRRLDARIISAGDDSSSGLGALDAEVSDNAEVNDSGESRPATTEGSVLVQGRLQRRLWWIFGDKDSDEDADDRSLVAGDGGVDASDKAAADDDEPPASRHSHARHSSTSSEPDSRPAAATTAAPVATTTTGVLNGYVGSVFYSVPGPCPDWEDGEKSEECMQNVPGGRCTDLTWDNDCTYQVESAGHVSLDELSGIKDHNAFVMRAGQEYDRKTDRGIQVGFWNHRMNADRAAQRVKKVAAVFAKKYPQFPGSLLEALCN